MMVLSEERLFVQNKKNTEETTFIKRSLQLIESLEADQLETEKQEPVYEQFGSKRLAALNTEYYFH